MDILVATGGAPHSTRALTFAAYLAQHCQARLTVLTVLKRAEDQAHAEEVLQRARDALRPLLSPDQIRARVRIGQPAEEIVQEAEERGYGLLVVGEKQYHGLLTRFVVGATAKRVIEHAPCPVVVVKGQVEPLERLLICDSGAEQDRIVDQVTTQLPVLLDGVKKITVLHVMSQMSAGPGVDGHQLRADAVELIDEDSPEARPGASPRSPGTRPRGLSLHPPRAPRSRCGRDPGRGEGAGLPACHHRCPPW